MKTTVTVPAADGDSAAVTTFGGGDAVVLFFGSDFDSGTAKLQVSSDGGNWLDAKDVDNNAVSCSANAMFTVRLPHGLQLRTSLSGSGGGASVTCEVHNVREARHLADNV